jgi:hypothetical protein
MIKKTNLEKGSAIVLASLVGALLLGSTVTSTDAASGFITGTPSYITLVDPSNDSIKALMTQGDDLPGGYELGKLPDGMGAHKVSKNELQLFVSHELNNGTNHGGKFAQVSLLTLAKDGSILDGEYLIDGTEGYERFCSGFLMEGHGFPEPIYFANEETDDGIVVGVTADGDVIEMPWLGEFAHENTIHVPYFNEGDQVVFLSFEDGEATESEIYMFVSDSPEDFLQGDGQLYVFGSTDDDVGAWDDIYYEDGWVDGEWIPLDWDYSTQDETDLHNEAISKGAFQFIRPEDGATDKRSSHKDTFYMADTGNNVDENDVAIPPGANGQTWEKGRMYQFEFTDKNDPTEMRFKVILDGNDSEAPGFGMLINPDNIDTSKESIMIQEDRIGVTRSTTSAPWYDITKNAKILRYDLSDGGLEIVAYMNQLADTAARHGDWESSGIIDVSSFYGKGYWLLDVQAHSLQEGGQLLLMKVDGS